jgi:GAF domain-containing protein
VPYPWLASKVLSGELVVNKRIEDLPPEAYEDLATARREGVKSHVTVPLSIGRMFVGGMSFSAFASERVWSQQEVQRLKLVAEIFGNALERKRVEAEVRRLSEELRQVSQVMTMGEVTASLAHELNQPLGAILNNARPFGVCSNRKPLT